MRLERKTKRIGERTVFGICDVFEREGDNVDQLVWRATMCGPRAVEEWHYITCETRVAIGYFFFFFKGFSCFLTRNIFILSRSWMYSIKMGLLSLVGTR